MMSKQAKKGCVPVLRFPEFREAGEWEEKTLGQVAKYENGKAHEQDIAESGNFIVVNSKFISTDGEVKKFTNSAFCIAKKEEVLMVLSDIPNGRAIAKCFFVDLDNCYTVNQRICKITPYKAVGIMLFYVLNRNSYFLAFDDGVKQTNLKKDDVLNCPILLPKDIQEQQKIAACLSSLDELITAQAQKVELLKTHKKGLMQQLFPAEGETVPKLRFPEFSGEWEVKKLEDISTQISYGLTIRPEYITNGIPLISAREIKTGFIDYENAPKISQESYSKLSKKAMAQKGDIFLSKTGTIGLSAYVSSDLTIAITQNIAVIRITEQKFSHQFVLQFFKTETFQESAISKINESTIMDLQLQDIRKLKIYIPSPSEQQKIAACLSSLDELITAQSQKLNALKTHKKGLMQQLFPAVDEVNA